MNNKKTEIEKEIFYRLEEITRLNDIATKGREAEITLGFKREEIKDLIGQYQSLIS